MTYALGSRLPVGSALRPSLVPTSIAARIAQDSLDGLVGPTMMYGTPKWIRLIQLVYAIQVTSSWRTARVCLCALLQ